LAESNNPETKKGVVGAFCKVYNVLDAMDKFLPGVYEETTTADRYTYAGGSTSGGAIIYDEGKFLYSNHATDPAGGKLINAFDSVQLHKFAELDDNAKPETPSNRLLNYMDIVEFF